MPIKTSFFLVAFLLISMPLVGSSFGQFTTVVNLPPDPDIGNNVSIGSDTQINLSDGGSIGDSFDAGASDGTSTNIEINITGGTVGSGFSAYSGSTVNISGGSIGGGFDSCGSLLNVSGGNIGGRFDACGGIVNVSGGVFEPDVEIYDGSVVNITGGYFPDLFRAHWGSSVHISGGTIGERFRTAENSNVTLSGGEFRLDGVLLSGLDLPPLSGTSGLRES